MISLGIVIPCYNESESLAKLIDKLSETNSSDVKYLILDNGSTDETHKVLGTIELPLNVSTHRIEHNQGYGFGVTTGLKILETDYVGWTHADLQTDPRDVLLFLDDISDGAKFLKGLRFGRPISDRFFTAGMSIFVSFLFQKVVRDINAQPTIISREVFECWQNPPNDFSLDLFAYIESMKLGHEVKRRRVNFGKRQYGKSHWNRGIKSRLKFIRRTLFMALNLRFNR
jgi:glycosyltransferase involved in cell wall biosynthesis